VTYGRIGLLAGLFAVALALRPQIVGLGPLIPEIQEDLGISHAVAGLLSTIPVACMGLFAPAAAYISGSIGTRWAIGLAVGLIGVAGVARALAPGAAAVLALTLPVGIGIAVSGALMPVAVKERFRRRPAFATGIYVGGINTGSAVAAAAAVPLAAAGSWRTALLAFSAASVALAALWLVQTRGTPAPRAAPAARPAPLPVRSGVAWLLVTMFALLGVGFYGVNAWLPDAYVEQGWSEQSAGALLAVLNIASIPGSLLVAAAAERSGSRRRFFVGCSAVMVVALTGVVLVPAGGFAWAALYGFVNGGLFALVMTLPLDVADEPRQVAAVAGLMLGAGYCLTSVAPFLLGAVRDLSGSFTGALWLIVGTATLFLALAATLTQERLHRGIPAAPRSIG
jgi:CP family cyanate transporter-like MFS transporter